MIKSLWQAVKDYPMTTAVAALIVMVATVALISAANQYGDWEEWCVDEMNGHVESDTRTSVGVGATTTHYCLSEDGHVLDIR